MTSLRLTASLPCLRAQSRHGVIAVTRLAELGIPARTSYRRCQPDGPWTLLLPGIVLLGRERPTDRQRVEAALLHADDHGLVTGLMAARRHGLRDIPDSTEVHLLLPESRRVSSVGFLTVERTIRLPEQQVRDGVPLAPPARAVLDAARRIRDPDRLLGILIAVKRSGLCSRGELRAELEMGSQRGTALPRKILNTLEAGDLRSVPEARALALWSETGLPAPEQNPTLFDDAGQFVGMPDLWAGEVAMAWEIDSYEYHQGREGYRATLERNTRYSGAGIVLVQTLPSRLSTEPDKVIQELRAAYAAAGRREPPKVFVRRPGV